MKKFFFGNPYAKETSNVGFFEKACNPHNDNKVGSPEPAFPLYVAPLPDTVSDQISKINSLPVSTHIPNTPSNPKTRGESLIEKWQSIVDDPRSTANIRTQALEAIEVIRRGPMGNQGIIGPMGNQGEPTQNYGPQSLPVSVTKNRHKMIPQTSQVEVEWNSLMNSPRQAPLRPKLKISENFTK